MQIKRLLLLIYLCSQSVFAIDSMTLKLGSITGTGWQTEGVVVHWLDDTALTLDITTLTLAALKKPLKDITLKCKAIQYNVKKISCPHANLLIGGDLLDKPAMNLSFSYYFNSQQIYFHLEQLALAGGKLSLWAKSAQTGWQVQLNIKKVALKQLLIKIGTLIDLPSMLNFDAHLTDFKIKIFGDTQVRRASLNGKATGVNFSNAEKTQVWKNMAMEIALKVNSRLTFFKEKNVSLEIISPDSPASSKRKHHIKKRKPQKSPTVKKKLVQGTLTLNRGEVYIDPVYIEIKEKPVTLSVDLTWQPEHLFIHHFTYAHSDVLNWQGSGDFTMGKEWTTNTLSVQLMRTALKPFYTHYLQTGLDDESQLKQLDISGDIEAKLDWNKARHIIAKLSDINIENEQKTFGLKGLNGKIQWHNNATHLPTHLHWESAYFLKSIKLGASQLRANLNGHRVKLLTHWNQPILDGAIRIDEFDLEQKARGNIAWQLRGQLSPISLSKLSAAIEWPQLSGQLSGKIPFVTYHDKQLEMNGQLEMRVFDGDIVLQTLSLNEPFGYRPELKADIEFIKLNLKTLTEALEFGEIQGQLSGYINHLHLVDWQPVSFNAYFGTPKDDTMPHKISQKAVQNLSNLGGNAAVNAISKSVLRIFEHFYYRRIGWGCRLKTTYSKKGEEKKICEMKGVGRTLKKGYYIIKGSLLPRIDIIGYEESVDWNVLISRIQTIINATGHLNAPIIK
jgi:hypothetical protein